MNFKIIQNYYRSLIIAVIILILTMLPGDSIRPVMIFPFHFLDKLAHFFVFMVLSIFLFADIKKNNNKLSNIKVLFLVLLINIFYGATIEVLQSVITIDRSAELLDLAANSLGILTGVLLQIKFKIIKY